MPRASSGESNAVRAVEPEVAIIATTQFRDPGWFPEWRTDAAADAGKLVEFAGRLCYLSFNNPLGRTNRQYIDNILAQSHFSVIEHVNVSIAIRGVSRSLTHELVRHRHFSYSQLSQRFVNEDEAAVVIPEDIARLGLTSEVLEAAARARDAYRQLAAALGKALEDEVPDRVARRKRARQAARAVLPNMTETALVVTGNLRAWAGFLTKRGAPDAEPEIRRLALRIHELLLQVSPEVFEHFEVVSDEMGRKVLVSNVDFA